MARSKDKIIARKIRREGKSIKDIAKELKIAKSTVSLWCRDIKLTYEQEEAIYKRGLGKNLKGRLIGTQMNRQKKINEMNDRFQEANHIIKKITQRDLLIAGACLYWAEGAKTGGRFIFVNSDPIMIKIIFLFLIKILDVNRELIHPTLQINFIHKKELKK